MKSIYYLKSVLMIILASRLLIETYAQENTSDDENNIGKGIYNKTENLLVDYKNILRFYELLEEYEFTNLYKESYIQSEIERDFILQPKDEFESFEEYNKRRNEFELKKNQKIADLRLKEFFSLQKVRERINYLLDSTGLFINPFVLEDNNEEPLIIQLGTYEFETKSFPIFFSASNQLFDYSNNSGRISFNFIEDAKLFKEDFTNNKYRTFAQFHYKLETNGTISVIFENLKLKHTETKHEINVAFSNIYKTYLKQEIPLIKIRKSRELITGWSIGTQIRFNIIYSPHKKLIAFFEKENPVIEIYDLYKNKLISRLYKDYPKNLTYSGDPYSFSNLTGRFSSDGAKLISWNPCSDPIAHRNQEDFIAFWDIIDSKLLSTYGRSNNDIENAMISFDNTLLLTLFRNIGKFGGNFRVTELKTGREIITIPFANLAKYESAILYNRDIKFAFNLGGNYIYAFPPDNCTLDYNVVDYKKNGEMFYKSIIENYFLTNDYELGYDETDGLRYTISEDLKTVTIWKKIDFSKFLRRDDNPIKFLVFDHCNIVNPNYLRFKGEDNTLWAFGEGPMGITNYKLCDCYINSGDCTANKEFVGKKFQVTYGFYDSYYYNPQIENVQLIKNAIIHDLNISPVPDEFYIAFNLFHKALKENNFNEAINYFIVPQNQGLFHKLDRKKITKEIKKNWMNYNWVNPNIYEDSNSYFDDLSKSWTNIKGISVDFISEDINFFFIKREGTYKILSVFINLQGGD